MICVPFLKFVNDRITSWLITSIAFFQSLLKPRTSWVTFPGTHTHIPRSVVSFDQQIHRCMRQSHKRCAGVSAVHMNINPAECIQMTDQTNLVKAALNPWRKSGHTIFTGTQDSPEQTRCRPVQQLLHFARYRRVTDRHTYRQIHHTIGTLAATLHI